MKTILRGWNIMRIFRLVLGTAVMVQGIVVSNTTSIILGVLFAGMAVANIGCCGASGCAVNSQKPVSNNSKEIHYEEVGSNK